MIHSPIQVIASGGSSSMTKLTTVLRKLAESEDYDERQAEFYLKNISGWPPELIAETMAWMKDVNEKWKRSKS